MAQCASCLPERLAPPRRVRPAGVSTPPPPTQCVSGLPRIREGERVLIHSAAGGVGLAAVHLCLRQGCTVYATASTPEKRSLLTSLGATAVFDSRDVPAFEDPAG